ncbi:hypothetical protein MAN_07638, partial [Metarhizium hybridum]
MTSRACPSPRPTLKRSKSRGQHSRAGPDHGSAPLGEGAACRARRVQTLRQGQERKHLVCGRGAGEYTVRSVGFVGKWVIHSAETEPTLEISPAGSYILGDAGISSEITNINPMDLGIKPLPLTGAKTVIDIFKRGQ